MYRACPRKITMYDALYVRPSLVSSPPIFLFSSLDILRLPSSSFRNVKLAVVLPKHTAEFYTSFCAWNTFIISFIPTTLILKCSLPSENLPDDSCTPLLKARRAALSWTPKVPMHICEFSTLYASGCLLVSLPFQM